MASAIYLSGLSDGLTGAIDYDTDTFNVSLHTSTYAPDKNAHTSFATNVTNEVSGTGYSAGGKAVTVTVTKDTANNRVRISLGGTTWTSSTITARYAVYRKASTGALVAYVDFGSDVISSNGTFTLNASTLDVTNP